MRILGVCLFLGLVWFSLTTAWRRRALRQWQRALKLDVLAPVFDTLYAPVNGFALSRMARNGRDAPEYTYGEICFLPFIALMAKAGMAQSSVFWDLGSGTGKAVVACAMVFGVQKSAGVECFVELHEAAVGVRKRLIQTEGFEALSHTLYFECASFLNTDFFDATHVFINASALSGDTWTQLVLMLQHLSEGSVVVITSKRLPPAYFELADALLVEMSWGFAQAFLYKRRDVCDNQFDNIE